MENAAIREGKLNMRSVSAPSFDFQWQWNNEPFMLHLEFLQ